MSVIYLLGCIEGVICAFKDKKAAESARKKLVSEVVPDAEESVEAAKSRSDAMYSLLTFDEAALFTCPDRLNALANALAEQAE